MGISGKTLHQKCTVHRSGGGCRSPQTYYLTSPQSFDSSQNLSPLILPRILECFQWNFQGFPWESLRLLSRLQGCFRHPISNIYRMPLELSAGISLHICFNNFNSPENSSRHSSGAFLRFHPRYPPGVFPGPCHRSSPQDLPWNPFRVLLSFGIVPWSFLVSFLGSF